MIPLRLHLAENRREAVSPANNLALTLAVACLGLCNQALLAVPQALRELLRFVM